MKNNKLIIAAAGSGKTTFLINESMKIKNEKVLITTYTENNAEEIAQKFIRKYKCIPNHITIQTWFSFLIQHGVKPYQGTFNNSLFDVKIKGMLLNNGEYGVKSCFYIQKKRIPVLYKEDTEFEKHYFSKSLKIYSDRLPKFVVKSNKESNGEVINRISRIYKHIFIDEVQDLAGYDLDIIHLLFKSSSNIILVGDPRQVTYLTHHERKYSKYKNGEIKNFIQSECKPPVIVDIDEEMLNVSHRNNQFICNYSSQLYPNLPLVNPCLCDKCRKYQVNSEGIFLVKPTDVDQYLEKYNPVQLRWSSTTKVNSNYDCLNFGQSKGKTFDRVIIYPTKDMQEWIFNNSQKLSDEARAKFYVAITRAKYSVAIITDIPDNTKITDVCL